MARILFIDDDEDFSGLLLDALEETGHGYRVKWIDDAERGVDLLEKDTFDLVLLDYRMPGMDGIDFLQALKDRDVVVPVVFLTGKGDPDIVIEAIRLGAFEYVEKTLELDDLLQELLPLIDKVLEPAPLTPLILPSGPRLVGKSKPMLEAYKRIGQFSSSDQPVLILGETGTGKELVAKAIHAKSRRKDQPFVTVNCAAIPEALQESELFGYAPQAGISGADPTGKPGKFELAHRGALFLDEIGDMSLTAQPKLLRALENGEVSRLGSTEQIKVDVRVLSATHRDLEAACRDGAFREDLYYRLNGVTIPLPPLRERGPEDLRELVEYFLGEAVAEGLPIAALEEDSWRKLRDYSWPGNVRELKNVLTRALLRCRGWRRISPDDLELNGDESAEGEGTVFRKVIQRLWERNQKDLWRLLHDMVGRELLKFALTESDGNQAQVAKRLGIARNTVAKLIKEYALTDWKR